MPIPTGYTPPAEKEYPLIEADVYRVEIEDVELEIKPNTFKKSPTDGLPEEKHQYKFKIKFLDPALSGRSLSFWTGTSLRASKKGTGLVDLLPKVLKTEAAPPKEVVTPDFINSLIGGKLRVNLIHKTSESTGKKYAVVQSFLVDKE